MRGKASRSRRFCSLTGITPAYAGKSVSKSDVFRTAQDHPRLCGEKENVMDPLISTIGSPPPMRGKDLFHDKFLHVFRITPAYAGKRFSFSVFVACIRDHPRLCGEKFQPLYSQLHQVGSPPPMRGKASTEQVETL